MDNDAVRHALDERPEARLRARERVLGAMSLGDVAHDRVGHLSSLEEQPARGQLDRENSAVLRAMPSHVDARARVEGQRRDRALRLGGLRAHIAHLHGERFCVRVAVEPHPRLVDVEERPTDRIEERHGVDLVRENEAVGLLALEQRTCHRGERIVVRLVRLEGKGGATQLLGRFVLAATLEERVRDSECFFPVHLSTSAYDRRSP
jgi:hypothetical protein